MLLGSSNLGGAGQEPKTSEDEGAGKGKGLGSLPPAPPAERCGGGFLAATSPAGCCQPALGGRARRQRRDALSRSGVAIANTLRGEAKLTALFT